jgi:hypothetical protein
MPDDTCSIFISHASVDDEIARSLKQYLGKAFPGHNIFVSSDPEDLRPGDEWVPKILAALETAKVVLVLATDRGLDRKWVWFEAGRTWFSGITMLPCCIGKTRKGNLIAPFSGRMGLNIDEMSDVKVLFERLGGMFGKPASNVDFDTVAKDMIRLDVRADERKKIIQDPFATEMINNIERRMKTLSPAEQETIRLFAVYGELNTAGVRTMVKDSGVDMNRWSVPQHLVEVTGWLNPAPGNNPFDDMQMNVYTVNHEIKPFLQAYFSRVNNHK